MTLCRVDDLMEKCGMMFDGLDTLLTYVRHLVSPLPCLPTTYSTCTYHTCYPQPLVAEVLSDALKKEAQLASLKQV